MVVRLKSLDIVYVYTQGSGGSSSSTIIILTYTYITDALNSDVFVLRRKHTLHKHFKTLYIKEYFILSLKLGRNQDYLIFNMITVIQPGGCGGWNWPSDFLYDGYILRFYKIFPYTPSIMVQRKKSEFKLFTQQPAKKF